MPHTVKYTTIELPLLLRCALQRARGGDLYKDRDVIDRVDIWTLGGSSSAPWITHFGARK